MSGDSVLLERRAVGPDGALAAVVTLHRPAELNAIDSAMLADLEAAFDEVAGDPAIRAVLLTGAGRAFSAGGDLKKYQELQRDPVGFPHFVGEVHRVFARARTLPVPVLALVNGVTAAGGLELLLNCDIVLVAESARIGDGHLNFGQMGGGGVLTLLWRAIGRARATELMLTGRFLDAPEAVAWGLASRCVPDADLVDEGLALAASIAEKSPLAVANARQVMHQLWAENGSVEAGLGYELSRNVYYCLTSHDAPEGLAAFAEKRPPRFEGR